MKKSAVHHASSAVRAHRPRSISIPAAVAAALGMGSTVLAVQPAVAQGTGDQSNEITEITVTGSRIVRRDLDAPSPITTIDSTSFERISTVAVDSVLNRLPQFRPAGTQFDGGTFSSTATSGPGVASANLRGLGANRTLVLIDGRRAQPSNATLAVDVNSIPAAAISSIEVITGGASSVYGADATAGVVNFVLRDDFAGLEVDAQTGITEVGDGAETRVSAVIGKNFGADEGNVLLGLEYSRRSAAHYSGRDFFEDGWRDPGTTGFGLINQAGYAAGTNAPSQTVINSLFPNQTPGTVSPANTFYFNTDGSPWQSQGAANYKGPYDLSIKLGPGGNVNQSFLDRLASQPLERYSAFGTANFAINEHVTAYLQGTYSSSTVETVGYYSPAITIWSAPIPYRPENPVPPGLAALLDARPDPTADWTLFRQFDFWGPMDATTKTSVYQVTAGLKGRLPISDWTWDAYVSNGSTDATVSIGHLPSYQRYKQVVAAPGYGAGFNMTGAYGQGINCTTGLAIFPGFTTSQDCFDAIETNLQQTTALEQNIVEATLQGKAFDLPAGEARFAVGVGRRSNDFDFNPGSLNAANSVLENPIGLFAVSSASGSTSVSEAYGELLLPLLSGKPMAQRLDLELGYRTSKYNLAGTEATYKALVSWRPNDALLLRGGYQRANRAPNVAELFQGGTVNTVTFATGDPCAVDTVAPWGNVASNPNRAQVQALCRAIIGNSTSGFDTRPGGAAAYVGPFGFYTGENAIVSGNKNLSSEDASTWTAGFVWRSTSGINALRNLSVAVDYYNIEISDAIAPTDAVSVYSACFNADGASNPTYSLNDPGGFCSLVRRDSFSGDRQSVNTPYINTGGIKTAGTDVQLNWRAAFEEIGLQSVPGQLSADVIVSFLQSFETKATDTAPYLESAGTLNQNGQFRWRSYTTLNYSVGAWNAGLNWTHLPSAAAAQSVQNPATTVLGVPSYDLFGLNASWEIGPTLSLRAGIDNVLDKEPPVVGANPGVNNNRGSTSPGFYDVLGRRYFVGARLRF
jgi:outer membrane receptor protein involved in Fe transport